MITVENITRKYGSFTAVDNVSFSIDKGEIVGLLGHNGAGKTTIMKMLTGYLEPTSGVISIDGKKLDEHRQEIQRDIGYLPENCPVYPEMSVVDYLDYSASLRGIDEKDRDDLIRDAIARTDLQDKAAQPISTLSRGYRQRTGVAQAILHKPALLILDEPTNGLDPSQIRQMRELIKEIAKHSTVIVSTHILQEVQAVCDRAIIINGGRKVVDSRLDELQSKNRLHVTVEAEKEKVIALFSSLEGIEGATIKEDADRQRGCTCVLEVSGSADHDAIAASVAKTVFDEGWSLFALGFEARDLESVFTQFHRV